MEHVEQEMRLSSPTVRRLRSERGWSQEQLAAVSGLSARTIQRVEAEGSASLETQKSLAATFGVPLADLAEAPVTSTAPATLPLLSSLARYKVTAIAGGVAGVFAALGVAGVVPATLSWLVTACCMIAIACLLYAGLGWYMPGNHHNRSRARHVAQALFIFIAIFLAFAPAYSGSTPSLLVPAGSGLLAIFIYFTVDFFVSRHRSAATTPASRSGA